VGIQIATAASALGVERTDSNIHRQVGEFLGSLRDDVLCRRLTIVQELLDVIRDSMAPETQTTISGICCLDSNFREERARSRS
jgi:hypothetical protein